ncbi:MAG: hypothetical protein CMJ83_09325 [Planctomycetes bacterium]|nr:hypothetical protein [Planctomycetota bacterium]
MSTGELLVVAGDTDPARGGQERSVLETLQAFADLGVRVTLAAPTPHDASAAAIIPLDAGRGGRAQRQRSLLEHATRVVAEHRGRIPTLSFLPVGGCDLYLPRGGLYPEAYARSAASRPSAIGQALTTLTARWNPVRRLLLEAESAILGGRDGPVLVALSNYVADQARRHYGLGAERVRVVRNGVALARLDPDAPADRTPYGIPEDATLIVAAATNPRLKGIPQLVEAVASLGDTAPTTRLIIAGPSQRSAAPENVHWLGPVEDLPALLRCADLLAHPTFYDPASRVVLEALALGVPVITTQWNGAADFITPELGIVLDDPSSIADLREAILVAATLPRHSPSTEQRTAISATRHATELWNLAKSQQDQTG